jgi:hypothetical protein
VSYKAFEHVSATSPRDQGWEEGFSGRRSGFKRRGAVQPISPWTLRMKCTKRPPRSVIWIASKSHGATIEYTKDGDPVIGSRTFQTIRDGMKGRQSFRSSSRFFDKYPITRLLSVVLHAFGINKSHKVVGRIRQWPKSFLFDPLGEGFIACTSCSSQRRLRSECGQCR